MPSIKIAHTSDIHGRIGILNGIPDDVDLVIDTGDFFPNFTSCDVLERHHQKKWFNDNSFQILKSFKGKPVIAVQGNHDYISLASMLHENNYPVYRIEPGIVHTISGITFAGFPGIPYISGHWWGEHSQEILELLAYQVADIKPDVLLTHAPAHRILHGGWYDGIKSLTNIIKYEDWQPYYMLHGHSHEGYGEISLDEIRTKFINGACHCTVHDLVIP